MTKLRELLRPPVLQTAPVLALALAAVAALGLLLVRPDSPRAAASPVSPDWSYTFQPAPGAQEKEITAALGPDGSVAITGGAGSGLAKLVRLNASGKEIWTRSSAGDLLFIVGFSSEGGQLYVDDAVGVVPNTDWLEYQLVALNAADGRLLWKRAGMGDAGPPSGPGSVVLDMAERSFDLYSAADGSLIGSISPIASHETWLDAQIAASTGRIVATTPTAIEVYSTSGLLIWRQISTPDPENDFGIGAQNLFVPSGAIVTLETKSSTPESRRIRLWSSNGTLTATVPLSDRPADIADDDVDVLAIDATGVTLVRETWWVESTEISQERYTAYSSTGRLLWQQTINTSLASSGLADAGNGRIFRALMSELPATDTILQLIDSSTGALLTERTVTGLPEADVHDAAATAGGRLFVLFSEGNTVTRFTLQP